MVPRQKGETHAYACHMMVPVNLSYFSNTKVVLLEDFPRLAVTDIAGFFHVLSKTHLPKVVLSLRDKYKKLSPIF